MLVNSSAVQQGAFPGAFGFAPFHLSGTVIAALLNDPAQLAALGDAAQQAPYKAAPRAPVLGVKPRNTLCGPGAAIGVPVDPGAVWVAASLGVVIGRAACKVRATEALQHVAGYLVAADLSLPLASHYRPAARARVRDGFCPLGPVVPASAVMNPDALSVTVQLDDAPATHGSTAGRVRGVAQLLADVSEFMTLSPGDVLLLGTTHDMPVARIGQAVQIGIAGVGTLAFTLEAA